MAIEQVLQEKFKDHQPFNPPENPDQETDALTPRENPLIEKWLGQLTEEGLFGWPHVKDYLYGLKRRNCRPSTIRSYGSTLLLFLSYLKQRGRTSLETTTKEDLRALSNTSRTGACSPPPCPPG